MSIKKWKSDEAFTVFCDMIRASWTWERLTGPERYRCGKALQDATRKAVRGSFAQRQEILQAVYYGFLLALDYQPIGWREPEKTPAGVLSAEECDEIAAGEWGCIIAKEA